ncbi:hypothetical protein SOV88_00465 [Pectobacterium brasiliense]|uniref:hypothetical protein n=1 Tax=Pectobacterium brasiliense TaxID=180957 RepID=UPI002A808051|nr:hypothetical protein [Pectobacterium brasiliense]MDY4322760.1 hypothetical protein [Pectobacterium brasiliense]
MINLNDEIDNAMAVMPLNYGREAYIAFFKENFPFVLCPPFFAYANELPPLVWTKVKYSEHEAHDFPDSQGVYMFMVSFQDNNLPVNSYVMYVGKAGDIGSANTISNRFMDYVRPSGYRSRPRIQKLVEFFSEHLYYYYATVPAGQSTGAVESTLANIFAPPCCQRDFTADMRSYLRGVRLA